MLKEHQDFWNRFDMSKPEECYELKNPTDYHAGLSLMAYEYTRGPIPEGHVIAHTCDNIKCCNPLHLAAVPKGELAERRRTILDEWKKVTKEVVENIHRDYEAGYSWGWLTSNYHLPTSTIRRILVPDVEVQSTRAFQSLIPDEKRRVVAELPTAFSEEVKAEAALWHLSQGELVSVALWMLMESKLSLKDVIKDPAAQIMAQQLILTRQEEII